MEAIKETINLVMQELAQKKKFSGGNTEELLKKVLTKKELAHIKCNYFKKGVLGVAVDSSALYYKLNLKKNQLLEALNAGSVRVKDINFRMGEV